MRILIFGATGRTGRHLVARAAARGWTVHAAGRDPERLLDLVGAANASVVDLDDAAAVVEAVRRTAPEVIVSSVGGAEPDGWRVDEAGNDAISNAAARCCVRRLVQISSLGCGDSRPFASDRIIAAIGPVLEAKTRAEDRLRALDLDWTIVRPGGLTDGDPTGSGALYADPRVHGRITRADLAELVLRIVASPTTDRLILSAVDRTTLPDEPADIQEFVAAV